MCIRTMNHLNHGDLLPNGVMNRPRIWHGSEVIMLRTGDLDLFDSEIQVLDSQIRRVGQSQSTGVNPLQNNAITDTLKTLNRLVCGPATVSKPP